MAAARNGSADGPCAFALALVLFLLLLGHTNHKRTLCAHQSDVSMVKSTHDKLIHGSKTKKQKNKQTTRKGLERKGHLRAKEKGKKGNRKQKKEQTRSEQRDGNNGRVAATPQSCQFPEFHRCPPREP